MSGVIFDLDGTLIDASRDMLACANAMLAEEDMPPITLDEIRRFVGRGLDALISDCIAAAGREETPEQHARMFAAYQRRYVKAVDDTDVMPNVRTALDRLKADGYRLAVCTNKPCAPTHAVLDHLGLVGYFDAFAYGDGPYPKKPDPAPVRHIVGQLAARRLLYVGDSEVDAETAQNAKLPMALYTGGFRQAEVEDLYHDAAFDDFADLPAIAARLAPRPD